MIDNAYEFSQKHLQHVVEFDVKERNFMLVKAPAEHMIGIILGHSDIPKFTIDAGCLRVLRTDKHSPEVVTLPMEWLDNIKIDGKAYKEEVFENRVFEISGSKGDKYTITERVDGSRTCTCPGFKYRGACRHI